MMRTMFAILLFAAMASTAGAQGRYQDGYYDDRPPVDRGAESVNFGYADVLRADPVFEYIRTPRPREECYDERVVRREGGDGTAGAVLGAIVGGALGNQVGKGDGRKAATIAGAVAGGVIGNEIEKEGDSGIWYEVFVRFDDGSRRVIRQRSRDGIREGDRVYVEGGRARLL